MSLEQPATPSFCQRLEISQLSVNSALEDQEDLLNLILDNIPQCIFWKDLNSVYLGCNQSWAEIVGISNPEEIIGKTDQNLFWAEGEAESYQESDRQVITTGKPETHRLTSRLRTTGEQLWFDASKVPIFDAQGHVVGILCMFENITERQQAADKLNKSADLLQLVLDNIPQALFWKDRNSVYMGCNKNWAQAAGIERLDDVIGKTDFELFWTPAEAELYCEQDRRVMETDTPVLHLIETRLHADGKQAWIDVNKLPIHDSEENVIGILGTIEDITDRKQAEIALQESEQRLRQQTQQLQQALRDLQQTQIQLVQTEKMSSLGQLVAGVAHEINNPVNFIFGNLNHAHRYIQDLMKLLQLYQQHYPTPNLEIQTEVEAIDLDFLLEDLPKLLSSMKVGADRIQQIVRSLRNFSRMDEAEMKAVNIHEGIESTLLILHSRLKAKTIRVTDREVPHPGIQIIKEYGDLPVVECYAGQLNQVFMNVLVNAIDALEEARGEGQWARGNGQWARGEGQNESRLPIADRLPPSIIIQTEQLDSERIAIRIRDNGPGMSETVLKRLFDPFFTTKPVGQGTGLGLSISYQIVTERHKGMLQCFSTPGEGSEFWIEIPIRQS